jgi:SAM-dependent MidA family methyltransferase
MQSGDIDQGVPPFFEPGDDVSATPASRLIADEIRRRGPIPFARFMELALYGPGVGYYTRRGAAPRPEADYVTSPEIHAAFGALICGQLVEMWEALGRPTPFWLVEGGPGSGRFAADVIGTAGAAFPMFAEVLRLVLVEVSPTLRARQEITLGRWRDRVRWLDPLKLSTAQDSQLATGDWRDGLGSGCVFANELLDALPVHRAVMTADGLRERYVTLDAGQFREVDGPLSGTEIADQIDQGGGQLAPSRVGEVNLEAPAWVASMTRVISRGYLLLLDYGEPAATLYGARHPRGTLRCYRQHTMNEQPFRHVGEQDITAHVDLSVITRAAEFAGAKLLGATSQEALLGRLGLGALVERARSYTDDRTADWGHQTALLALVDPAGLGHVSALLFGKDAPLGGLSGFNQTVPRIDLAEAVAPVVFKRRARLEGRISPGSR